GRTTVLSTTCVGVPGNGDSVFSSLSADGQLVAFASDATNLVTADTNGDSDAFVHDRSLDVFASWSNYGSGFPGSNGIPSLTSSADPVFGTTLSIDMSNSLGAPTFGLVLFGLSSASMLTSAGGTILVDPVLLLPLMIGASGASIPIFVSQDESLCG